MAKHLIIIIYFGLCLFLGVSVKAQISHGGQPLPLTATKSLTEDMFITMPPFDLAEQLRLDSLEATGLRNGFRFAYKFVTDYTPENSGVHFTQKPYKIRPTGQRSGDSGYVPKVRSPSI